jgi:hypothetical protein
MNHKYHTGMLTSTLAAHFSPAALREVIAGNLRQDYPPNLFKSSVHFDNCDFSGGLAYIEAQHALIAKEDDPHLMRRAFGRLTHTAQDFYAHTNYVDLWLNRHGGLHHTRPGDINGLDDDLHHSPQLRSGWFFWWRDIIYYLPLLRDFAKKYVVFADSHEAMNLDSPRSGPKFWYAIGAAKQRTVAEYRRVLQTLGPERAALFHGSYGQNRAALQYSR